MAEKRDIPTGIVGLAAVLLGILGRLFLRLNATNRLINVSDSHVTIGGIALVLLVVGGVVSAIAVKQKSARRAGAAGLVLAGIFLLPVLLAMAG